jgi:hypothetical protein
MALETMNHFQIDPAHRYSATLERIRTSIENAGDGPQDRVKLSEVISFFGPKGHALLSVFFVLPFLQPIPIPGLSVVLGTCIALFGFFMCIGRPPWVPERVAKIEVEKKFLLRVTRALESLLKKVERISRPRYSEIFDRVARHAPRAAAARSVLEYSARCLSVAHRARHARGRFFRRHRRLRYGGPEYRVFRDARRRSVLPGSDHPVLGLKMRCKVDVGPRRTPN